MIVIRDSRKGKSRQRLHSHWERVQTDAKSGGLAIIVDHVGRAGTDCWVNYSIKGKLNRGGCALVQGLRKFGGTHGLGRNQRVQRSNLNQAGPSAETGLG